MKIDTCPVGVSAVASHGCCRLRDHTRSPGQVAAPASPPERTLCACAAACRYWSRAGTAAANSSGVPSARPICSRPTRRRPSGLSGQAAPRHLPADRERHAASRTGDVACERPADERVGVPVSHAVLGLQVSHDGHVLAEAAVRDDLLPLRDRAPVLLLDGRKYDAGPCFGQGGACSAMVMCSLVGLRR